MGLRLGGTKDIHSLTEGSWFTGLKRLNLFNFN